MSTTTTFAYSIDLIGLFEHPSTIEKALRPGNATDFKWVHQAISDQVWVFYQFATAKEKNAYGRAFKSNDRVRVLTLPDDELSNWM